MAHLGLVNQLLNLGSSLLNLGLGGLRLMLHELLEVFDNLAWSRGALGIVQSGCSSGLLRGSLLLLGSALGSSSGLGHHSLGQRLHQFNDGHGSRIALTWTDLRDAGVAARAGGVARTDLGEELVHDTLVANHRENATTCVQVSALGEGDHALSQRANTLGLGLGGGDLAVLEQCSGQVREDQALVSRTAAETGTLGRGRHVSSPGLRDDDDEKP